MSFTILTYKEAQMCSAFKGKFYFSCVGRAILQICFNCLVFPYSLFSTFAHDMTGHSSLSPGLERVDHHILMLFSLKLNVNLY